MDFKLHSIVIGKFNVGETDRLYVFYTKEMGKTTLLGKGTRKPESKLAGSLEPLTLSEIFAAKGRGKGKITGAIVINNFSSLKKNVLALERVFSTLKIFNRLVSEEEKEEKIFNLLLKYLEMMDGNSVESRFIATGGCPRAGFIATEECPNDGIGISQDAGYPQDAMNRVSTKEISPDETKLDIFTLGFIFQLLHLSGYGLETKKCVACGRKILPGNNFFSPSLGGTVCCDCAKTADGCVSITDETIKFIRIFLENKLENLGKIRAEQKNLKNLKLVADVFVKWTIG